MREEELRAEFDVLLTPVRSATPPHVAVIKERLRRRRMRLGAGAGGTAAAIAIAGAVLAVQLTSGPASGPVAAASGPALTPGSTSVPPAASPGRAPTAGSPTTKQSTLTYIVPGGPRTLVITSELGDVTITGSQRSSIMVSETRTYSSAPPIATHNVSENTLALSYTCPRERECGVSYDVQVPTDTSVVVREELGAVTVERVSGSVSVTASMGDISAVNLTSRSVTLTADDGTVSAGFLSVPDSVQVTDSLGAISIGVPGTASYRVTAQASLGQTTVSVPQSSSSPHVITATADLGSIIVVAGNPVIGSVGSAGSFGP